MKKILSLSILISFFSCAVKKASSTDNDKIIQKYTNSITAESLKKHLTIVAADDMEGRDTGSKGQKKAGLYLINHYKTNDIASPDGAENYMQKVPAAYMNKFSNENLPDSENILAFIKGSEKPDEILVISAHYDHVGMKKGVVYNGADDDGSGTVALLEMAKAFKTAQNEGLSPKRSILFIHMTGEEHGLYGSSYYTDNPLFPLKNTITDINIDMIGRRDDLHKNSNNYVYVIGSDFLSTDLYNITEAANKNYVNLNLDYKFNNKTDPERFYYRSDHYNFVKTIFLLYFYSMAFTKITISLAIK